MFASSISRPWLCVFDTIVLSNGCFDINPVLCPSTVVLSQGTILIVFSNINKSNNNLPNNIKKYQYKQYC